MAIITGDTAEAEYFIDKGEIDATPANDDGRVAKLESDAKIAGLFRQGHLGDGSDGAVTLDGTNTYASFLSKSGNTYTMLRNMYATTLDIQTGKTLVTDGYVIFAKVEIKGGGTVDWGTPNNGGTAVDSSSGVVGAVGAGGAQSGGGRFKNTAGASGANGLSGESSSPGGSGASKTSCLGSTASEGGRGGSTGPSNAGDEGDGGTATAPYSKFGLSLSRLIDMMDIDNNGAYVPLTGQPGAGGGGGGMAEGGTSRGGSGGGGGASGGTVVIFARLWSGTFTIRAVGGNGGNGGLGFYGGSGNDIGSGGGGAGGNGGVVVVGYHLKTWSGSYTLTAGTAGVSPTQTGGSFPSTGTDGTDGVAGSYYEFDLSNCI